MGNDQLNDRHKRQTKDKICKNQVQVFYEYLLINTVTASQVEAATGIKQKNVCRYKRVLEKANLLWEFKEIRCPITGHWAWTLTTDPNKVEVHSKQLNLFDNGI